MVLLDLSLNRFIVIHTKSKQFWSLLKDMVNLKNILLIISSVHGARLLNRCKWRGSFNWHENRDGHQFRPLFEIKINDFLVCDGKFFTMQFCNEAKELHYAPVLLLSFNDWIHFLSPYIVYLTIKIFNLTPMYTNVSLGDVNKNCFDDYAHTVHW